MQEPLESGRPRRRALIVVAALATAAALGGCAATQSTAETPGQAAAQATAKAAPETTKEEIPSATDSSAAAGEETLPEIRKTVLGDMSKDRGSATFDSTTAKGEEPPPLVTAAPPDPFASSTVITSDSVTRSDQVAGLPPAASAGEGQLAAIIFFTNGSASLDPQDRKVLQDLARLREQRGGSLRIVGHASSWTRTTTPEEHDVVNFEMSLKRANAVRDELVSLGVPEKLCQTEAVSDSEPVYHEFMPSGEAGNRRVEIFLEN